MKLTENFSLLELTKSQTAERKGIDNTPSPTHQENLKSLCEMVLQPIRDHFLGLWPFPADIALRSCVLPSVQKLRVNMQKEKRPTSKSLAYPIKNSLIGLMKI